MLHSAQINQNNNNNRNIPLQQEQHSLINSTQETLADVGSTTSGVLQLQQQQNTQQHYSSSSTGIPIGPIRIRQTRQKQI